MLLLHLFEYDRAAVAFKRAETLDPQFAMAYWGEAMTATHPVWDQQNIEAGRATLARLAPTPEARAAKAPTEREKAFLGITEILYGEGSKPERDRRVAEAMEAMAKQFPDDDEVQLFLSLALLGKTEGVRDLPNFLRAAELAKAAYRRNPQHPGAAHYWIHGMDDPANASGALEAAHALSKIAPGAGHAQHMTSHIFMALGMWDEVVASNEAAERVSTDELHAEGRPPMTCGHYAEWLQYAYFQQGRERDGYQILATCQREGRAAVAWLRQHPDNPAAKLRPPAALKARIDESLVGMRAVTIVESPRFRRQAATMDIDVSDIGRANGWALFSRGLEQAWRGDVGAASRALAALRVIAAQPDEPGDDAHTGAYLTLMSQMLEGAIAQRQGHGDRAVQLATSAALAYEAIPFDFGPPVPVKPPREFLGELLLAAGRPQEALAAFDQALQTAPKRALSLAGRARAAANSGSDSRAPARHHNSRHRDRHRT